jgi:hypothetical protein
MKTLMLSLLLAIAAAPAAAQDNPPAEALKDYTCWSLLTEPEENQGSSEVFYLGYALGKAGRELKDEAAYKQVVADVLKRCQGEPDLKVLDAFEQALPAP